MEYYSDDMSALPYGVIRDALVASDVPRVIAAAVAFGLRAKRKLGFTLKAVHGFPADDGAVIDRSKISAQAKSKWAPIEEELSDIGFQLLAYCQPRVIGPIEKFSAFFLSDDQATIATLNWLSPLAGPPNTKPSLEFNSYGVQDPEYMTIRAGEVELVAIQVIEMEFLVKQCHPIKASVAKVYSHHQDRIDGIDVIRLEPETVEAVHDKRGRRRLEAVLKTGIIRRLTDQEVSELSQHSLSKNA